MAWEVLGSEAAYEMNQLLNQCLQQLTAPSIAIRDQHSVSKFILPTADKCADYLQSATEVSRSLIWRGSSIIGAHRGLGAGRVQHSGLYEHNPHVKLDCALCVGQRSR